MESQSILTQVTLDVLAKRSDVSAVSTPDQAPGLWLSFMDGPDYFAEECIYDACSDSVCRELLLDFFDCLTPTAWGVQLELSKLLSKRGDVVRERVEPLVLDPKAYFSHTKALFFSYLAVMHEGESRVIHFLDVVPSDSRDGIFLAAYRLGTEPIFRKLLEKVREWYAKDRWWGHDGTGEAFRVRQIVEKCKTRFPKGYCDDVLAICRQRPSD